MRRIVVIGNSGSGKSRLARRMGERLGLPVIHLDALYWEPGWREPDNHAFRVRVAAALAGGAWVSEGNYARRTFDLRLPGADLVIWMETPRWLCLWRVLWRTALARPRPDLPAGCRESLFEPGDLALFRDIWTFDRERRPAIERRLAQGAAAPVVRLRGRGQIEAFLASLG
jgi:adenylate kinase family enzyme